MIAFVSPPSTRLKNVFASKARHLLQVAFGSDDAVGEEPGRPGGGRAPFGAIVGFAATSTFFAFEKRDDVRRRVRLRELDEGLPVGSLLGRIGPVLEEDRDDLHADEGGGEVERRLALGVLRVDLRPASRRIRVAAGLSHSVASWRGVRPFLNFTFTSAPAATRASTGSGLPGLQAEVERGLLVLVARLQRCAAAIRADVVSPSPSPAATWRAVFPRSRRPSGRPPPREGGDVLRGGLVGGLAEGRVAVLRGGIRVRAAFRRSARTFPRRSRRRGGVR